MPETCEGYLLDRSSTSHLLRHVPKLEVSEVFEFREHVQDKLCRGLEKAMPPAPVLCLEMKLL